MNELLEVSDEAQRAEQARDLRKQVEALAGSDYSEQEIILRETSPARKMVPLYNMEDGSQVMVYRYRLDTYLSRTIPGTNTPMFTSDPSRAPTYLRGNLKCFLAADSPERDILNRIGLGKTCPANHIPNEFAREQHAEKKHKAEWKAYKAYMEREDAQSDRELRRQEVAAMMAMAGQKAPAAKSYTCDECGFETTSNIGLVAHKRTHAK